jgi:multidrug transporter EmrE-like cation transporter
MAVVIVGFAIALNVLSGIVLKNLASQGDVTYVLLAGGIALALALNLLRFAVWALAHRRYPLSFTYPMTSLFYPIMLAVAYYYQEPIYMNQWVGTILITLGVVWLGWRLRL